MVHRNEIANSPDTVYIVESQVIKARSVMELGLANRHDHKLLRRLPAIQISHMSLNHDSCLYLNVVFSGKRSERPDRQPICVEFCSHCLRRGIGMPGFALRERHRQIVLVALWDPSSPKYSSLSDRSRRTRNEDTSFSPASLLAAVLGVPRTWAQYGTYVYWTWKASENVGFDQRPHQRLPTFDKHTRCYGYRPVVD